MTRELLESLEARGLTISFAESLTGGALAYAWIKHRGASRVVRGALVAYHSELKASLLGVPEALIERDSPVSETVARVMAHGCRDVCQTDLAVSTTGNAGPSLQDQTDRRVVWIAVSDREKTITRMLSFKKETRIEAIELTVKKAIDTVGLLLKNDG
ncbi:MAG: CinA family protein [Acholeplasmataceae bacterium]